MKNLPNNKFCVLPWISLEASPIGTVRPCCLADKEITNELGNKYHLSTSSLSEIQSSAYMQDLRQQFLNGKQPETCRRCWAEEDAGRTSKRMHTLDRLKHMVGKDNVWQPDAQALMFLDLKLGNICNLKCRICGPWSSSQYATEDIKFNITQEHYKYSYKMLKDGAWPRENKNFWNDLDQHLDNIRYLEFTGGEPFMIREHFQLLQKIVDRGVANQVEIHYNTNGTQWPEEAESIWQHFKHVEIAFSIDDIEQRFEYQRTNAVWDEVVENLSKYKELRSRHRNITLQVCCTVNIFNVYYLEHVANWVEQQNFDFIYWNLMHDAYYFSIATLPAEVKVAIAEKLNSADVSLRIKQEFNDIIKFMNLGDSLDGTDLRTHIKYLDVKRKQHLMDVAPEFAKLIDYEKN